VAKILKGPFLTERLARAVARGLRVKGTDCTVEPSFDDESQTERFNVVAIEADRPLTVTEAKAMFAAIDGAR